MAVTTLLQIFKPTDKEDDKDGWAGAKIMLGDPRSLLTALKNYGEKINKVTRN
jgi:hypothetical protein